MSSGLTLPKCQSEPLDIRGKVCYVGFGAGSTGGTDRWETNIMDDHGDKILEKVRALLAKAERTEFEAEADSYREKAFALMAKYELDEAALYVNSDIGPRPIVKVTRTSQEPYGTLKLSLWGWVGDVFGVKTVLHPNGYGKRGYNRATCYGTQAAHDMTEFLVTSLLVQAATLLPNVKAEVGPKERSAYEPSTRALRIGWLTGFFSRCTQRIREAHAMANRSAVADPVDNAAALVLLSDAKRTEDVYRTENPRLTSLRRSEVDTKGYIAGRQAGNYANIGTSTIGGSHRAIGR